MPDKEKWVNPMSTWWIFAALVVAAGFLMVCASMKPPQYKVPAIKEIAPLDLVQDASIRTAVGEQGLRQIAWLMLHACLVLDRNDKTANRLYRYYSRPLTVLHAQLWRQYDIDKAATARTGHAMARVEDWLVQHPLFTSLCLQHTGLIVNLRNTHQLLVPSATSRPSLAVIHSLMSLSDRAMPDPLSLYEQHRSLNDDQRYDLAWLAIRLCFDAIDPEERGYNYIPSNRTVYAPQFFGDLRNILGFVMAGPPEFDVTGTSTAFYIGEEDISHLARRKDFLDLCASAQQDLKLLLADLEALEEEDRAHLTQLLELLPAPVAPAS